MMNNLAILTCFLLGFTLARPNGEYESRKIIIDDETSKFFENQFNKTIQCIRKQLITGNPEKGIPSMDPLSFSKIVPVDIDEEYLKVNLELNKLVIDGLIDFDTISLDLSSTLVMESSFHFNKISLTSLYTGDMNILGLYAFYGEGDFNIDILNLDIKIATQYQMTPPLVGDYSVVATVEAVNLTITGLLGDEELSRVFSEIASKTITALINTFQKQITSIISPVIQEKINSQIGHLAFLDFLALITNYSCE